MLKTKLKPVARQGHIDVPGSLNTDDFADCEELFRHLLWPAVPEGYERESRRLLWMNNRKGLYYRIVDTPKPGARINGQSTDSGTDAA